MSRGVKGDCSESTVSGVKCTREGKVQIGINAITPAFSRGDARSMFKLIMTMDTLMEV